MGGQNSANNVWKIGRKKILIFSTNTIKVLGNVASKIRSVTEVFLGLIDMINILQISHEIEKCIQEDVKISPK